MNVSEAYLYALRYIFIQMYVLNIVIFKSDKIKIECRWLMQTLIARLGRLICMGVLVLSSAFSQTAFAENKHLAVQTRVELDKYLGLWYEVARKPIYYQQVCVKEVTARYTLNENGNIVVDNRCMDEDGQIKRSLGEAFVVNPPFNSKLKVSFMPDALRWLPVGRGDYWILKLDEHYQMALVGEPRLKYMWILSREAQPDPTHVQELVRYAKGLGYDVENLIYN